MINVAVIRTIRDILRKDDLQILVLGLQMTYKLIIKFNINRSS